ncbi:esterase [Castellaniella sp.]|uniref:esterase n=1 Tax=Castellaniella sp. TaxID=1955812 RepID=UPI002AFF37AB|nr:esterase [Castellaniella sp.]
MSNPPDARPDPLLILPADGSPTQLFILLHGESAEPGQMLDLVAAIRSGFPQAVIIQPYGPFGDGDTRRWIAEAAPDADAYVGLISAAATAIAADIAAWQSQHGLDGEQTALVGFSEGAAVALEAVCATSDLAGRAILFSTRFATLPSDAPRTATLHLLHGAEDRIAPMDQARQVHARLAELQGDVTLDIASGVGHDLHAALIHQAIVRLQTCVPLRLWENAQGAPKLRIDEYSADDLHPGGGFGPETLH